MEREGEEDYDSDRLSEDRPDAALAQDEELTRDPNTGRVPRERLLAAARYNATMLARPAAGTLAAGIWTERGPSNVGGRIRTLLLDPADASGNTIWAGSAGGGLWKGTNAATGPVQWTNVNSQFNNLSISSLAAAPGNPQVMYCGTGEGYFNSDAIQGAGIWKTVNGGQTWTQLPATANPSYYHVQKVAVHPVTGDVYAATRTGLYRSTDGGATWAAVLSTATTPASLTPRVADFEIGADNTLYAAFGLGSTDGIYRSTTGNVGSWTKLNTLPNSGLPTTGFERIKLAAAPSDANRLYAILEASATGGLLNIYRSLDGGNTWAALSRPGATASNPTYDYTNGQAWYDLAAVVSPTDPNLLYVGGVDIWLTTNAGETDPAQVAWARKSFWNISTTSPRYVHADHHAMVFVKPAAGQATRAYFGCDGGVFVSDDANANTASTPSFAERNTGLNVTQYYAVAMHPTSYNYFLAGAQDNGTQRYTGAGINSTARVTGGDGAFCAIDQRNTNFQFTSYVYNQYFRSTNGGSSFSGYAFSSTKGYFINPFEYDSQTGTFYASYTADSCLVWTNAGTTQAPITRRLLVGSGTGRLTHVSLSPSVRKRIYVGTNTGYVVQVDSATTTTPVTRVLRRPASPGSVSCVAIDPTDENHLLITFYQYGITSVYETKDANAATPTWTSVEGSLPDMPVRWALFDPRNPARALLATEMGVYCTELLAGSATVWVPAHNSMVNTRVDMLRYRPGDQLVAAATHGRGLYTSDLLFQAPLSTQPRFAGGTLSAYPNPFSSALTVELGAAVPGEVAAQLVDALGRSVYTTRLRPVGTQLRLDVPSAVPAGTYTLVVGQGTRQVSRRVLKR